MTSVDQVERTVSVDFTPDELSDIITSLGGKLSKRTLGGYGGKDRLALRSRLEGLVPEPLPDRVLTRAEAVQAIRDGKIERYCVPGQWRATKAHGVPIVEELG